MTINPTDVRANGSSLRGYMANFKGAQVLEATINSDAAALSATSLDITILTGSIADVQRGYICQFFSALGVFKGQSHIRWGGTLDATHLPVREFSQSEFLIKALDTVQVFALMAFEDKLVTDTDLFEPDGVPVGTYNSAPPPLAASGGYDAGFVDGYETATPLAYRTQTTNGAPSLILDPTSTPGNLSHLWTLPTGVSFAPGSAATDESPTLRVTVGEYTVYHDVTDNDNGQAWRQCVTYQCFDGVTRSPVSCIMESAPTGDPAQGWSCTFRAVNFLTLTDAPDGSLCLFFVRERINGTWQSLGGTEGRSAVKLLGYLAHDESDLTPQLQYQRFEVISPLVRLSQLPGFSKVMFQNEAPDDWSKVSTALTTLRAMIQLIRIYTFALDGGHDLLTGTYLLDVPYPELWLQKESPRQQVDELADGVDARFTCTRTGLFRLDPVLALLDLPYRAASSVGYTFQRQDVARLVARRNHLDTVETLELHATSGTNSGDTANALAYFSRAPGSPGHGADFITIERIIATANNPQDDTNARAGRRYALRNGVFTSSNTGHKSRAPEIDVEMRQVYDFLDFDDQIIHFGSFPNPRDIDLTFFDWALARVRLDYASGKVISTFQALTDSPPGASYFPPSASVIIPPPPPLVYPIAPPTLSNGLPGDVSNLALFSENGFVYLTANFQNVSPTWTNYSLIALGMAGTLVMFIVDAFSPLYAGTGTTVNGWIVTTTEVRRITDIFGTAALGTATTLTQTTAYRNMQFERGVPNYGFIASYGVGDGVYGARTTDGDTWSEVQINSFHDTGAANGYWPGASLNYATGQFLTTAFSADNGAADLAGVGKLTSTGASFANTALIPATGNGLAGDITQPFQDQGTVYYGFNGAASSAYKLYKTVNGGTPADVSPTIAGDSYGPVLQFQVKTCDVDKTAVLMIGTHSASPAEYAAFYSSDGAASWANIVSPPGETLGGNISGNDPLTLFLWGTNSSILFSTDGGATIQVKTGNIVGAGRFLNLCGGG